MKRTIMLLAVKNISKESWGLLIHGKLKFGLQICQNI